MITDQQPAAAHYAGLDLHKHNAVVDVLDSSGTSVYHGTIRECKRERIRALKARFGPGLRIVLESTYNWYWVVDECRRQAIAVQLGHALDIKRQMPGKHKSDPRDARRMAEMARMETFPEVYAAPVSHRATRDLMRRRQALVQEQTRFVLHHQCVADQYLMDEEPLDQAGYAPEVIADITRSRAVDDAMIRLLEGEITRLERYIERRVAIHDEEGYTVLRSVPGIGRVLALVLLYEIQDLARFTRVQHFSSYCRVVNPQCESNGKRAGVGDVRRGNRYLCWALHELVNSSCRHCPAIKSYYARLRRRRSARHAHRIMAHRWAVAIYFMLKRKEPFDLDKFLGSAYESAKGGHCADR